MLTNRPPDPQRFAMVERLVRRGVPDRDIVQEVMAKFDCCENTVRNDLRRLWKELASVYEDGKAERRNVMRYQLAALQVEVRDVADAARQGFTTMGPEGEPVTVQDMKTASMALKTSEALFGRLMQLDGVSESDRVKNEILRQKLLKESGLTEEQLDAMIAAEVAKAIKSMAVEELEQLVAERKGEVQ